jgi:hypothetical protein
MIGVSGMLILTALTLYLTYGPAPAERLYNITSTEFGTIYNPQWKYVEDNVDEEGFVMRIMYPDVIFRETHVRVFLSLLKSPTNATSLVISWGDKPDDIYQYQQAFSGHRGREPETHFLSIFIHTTPYTSSTVYLNFQVESIGGGANEAKPLRVSRSYDIPVQDWKYLNAVQLSVLQVSTLLSWGFLLGVVYARRSTTNWKAVGLSRSVLILILLAAALVIISSFESASGSDTPTSSRRTIGGVLTILVERVDGLEARTTYEFYWFTLAARVVAALVFSFPVVWVGVRIWKRLQRRVLTKWSTLRMRAFLVSLGILAFVGLQLLFIPIWFLVLFIYRWPVQFAVPPYEDVGIFNSFYRVLAFSISLAFVVAAIGVKNSFWIPIIIAAISGPTSIPSSTFFPAYVVAQLSWIPLLEWLALIGLGAVLFLLRKRFVDEGDEIRTDQKVTAEIA